MSKSIRKSKIVFFLFLNISFSLFSYAQTNIIGRWAIKEAIGLRDLEEYSLTEQKQRTYGLALLLKEDGKFYNEDVVDCPNGSSVLPLGTYTLIDDYHIQLVVKDVHIDGLYAGMVKINKLDLIKDLGIFYIYKEGNSIRLIKSNSILQDDKDKMLYTEMLNTFDKNWKSYDYSWGDTKAKVPEEIIKDCIDSRKLVDLSNCKILFSKNEVYGKLFLVREKENLHYVLYNEFDQKVSLAYPR